MPQPLRLSVFLLALAVSLGLSTAVASAGIPPIMSYSGQLQGPDGTPLADGTYRLTFALYASPTDEAPVWTEVHDDVEVAGGNFYVVLGRSGPAALIGVPFDKPYFLGVSVNSDPEMAPRQALVTLPYAFRSKFAEEVADGSITTDKIGAQAVTDDKIKSVSWDKITGAPRISGATSDPGTGLATPTVQVAGSGNGVSAMVWSLQGNLNSKPGDFLGTTDAQPLVIKVNNEVKMEFPVGGPVKLSGGFTTDEDLEVSGDTRLHGKLYVDGATYLYSTLDVTGATSLLSSLNVSGATSLASTLGVTGATNLSSSLGVTGATNLGSTLGVTGATSLGSTLGVTGATNLASTLGVSGATSLGSTLGVTGATNLGSSLGVTGATNLSGSLGVTGATSLSNTLGVAGATTLSSTLGVGGAATLSSTLGVAGATTLSSTLGVTGAASFNGGASTNNLTVAGNTTGYVALIQNTDATLGDGLKIKLGRTHPMWNGTSFINATDPFTEPFDGALNTVKGWVFDGNTPSFSDIPTLIPAAYIAGTLCHLANAVLNPLNTALGLPKTIAFDIPEISCDPGCTQAQDDNGDCDKCDVEFGFPAINLPCSALPSLSMPNLTFVDVDNSLTIENEYIRFADKDDRMLGAVRAQSVEDWEQKTVNANYLLNILAQVVGYDLLGGVVGAVSEFSNLTYKYNHIGVEYLSGHGDYAEWLERVDPEEPLLPGDIVAVRGGRITRDMDGAEQVMAVSENPIVLGNMPPADREALGNKVAFIGQIPVKVMGPIRAGDYIVARSEIPGYGVAVTPGAMTADDLALCVGRSWETNALDGPKMVNTVVGVQNGNFVKVIKDVMDANQALEARMQTIELKMDRMTRPNVQNATYKAASTGN